ncbi:hypothetical protein ABH15_03665 [Methanoculleus taiwanensis]|uniref:histidine kinase n=1 Tax=Methanoculleus taiwanensis TaxID=1550565 RepID=A0A498H2E5_9EURY|nr:PAS domain S-box protein [Methanoculleus taiwanensis]RXE57219.1 hypothetical protein ABH15_03665 [Methanoculleus taiwanensis]
MNETTLKRRIAAMRSALTTIAASAEDEGAGRVSRICDAVRLLSNDLDALECESGDRNAHNEGPGSNLPIPKINAILAAPPGEVSIFDRSGRCTCSNRLAAASDEGSAGLIEAPAARAREAALSGCPVSGEIRHATHPPYNGDGDVGAVIGASYTITDRIETEERVLASERRFKTIFETSPIGIAYCGISGRLLDVNPAFTALFGAVSRCTPGDLSIFTIFPDLLTGRERLLSGETLHEVVRWESGRGRSSRGTLTQGTLYLDVWVRPIRSPEKGSVKGYLIHIQDITGQITIREIKQQAYDQIERNIEQFAILGDHIRHPLQVIQARADLLEDEDTSRSIAEQVQRINAIIKELDRGWVESRKIREFLRKNDLSTVGSGKAA